MPILWVEKMKHREEEKWDSSSQSQSTFSRKLGIQLLILGCNHYTICLCFKVTITVKSIAVKLARCWRTPVLYNSHRIRQDVSEWAAPPPSAQRTAMLGQIKRLSLRSILFPTVAINGCPKEENKNRLSIYNTPVSLYLYAYIFPPCFHLQSFPAHWAPDVVSACSVAISWFLFH